MSKLDERAKAIAARCRTVGSHEAHDVICELLDKLFVTEDQRDVAVLSEQEMATTEGLIRDELAAANKRVEELEKNMRQIRIHLKAKHWAAAVWVVDNKALSPKQEGGG